MEKRGTQMKRGKASAAVTLGAAMLTIVATPAPVLAAAPRTVRVSVTGTGRQADGFEGVLSANQRYVAFDAFGPLRHGDDNDTTDIYVRDLRTGKVTLVSVTPAGKAGAGESWDPDISDDGRFVSFSSQAPDLVAGDTNGVADIFVRDLKRGVTVRASVTARGGQAEGEWISSYNSEISGDGRRVAFTSSAPNLVPRDKNGDTDVFVRDLRAGTTVRATASADPAGGGGSTPTISANGRFVAFESFASDLVPGDTNDDPDFFVHDLRTRKTTRVSVSSSEEQAENGICCLGDVAISATGRYVAFTTQASNLVPGDTNGADVFVRDRLAGTTTRASLSDTGGQLSGDSENPTISADGRYVGFATRAADAVRGDTNDAQDVFVRDRLRGRTIRVSVSTAGCQADGDSQYPHLSGTARSVVFGSKASNLVPGDTNDTSDVFVRYF